MFGNLGVPEIIIILLFFGVPFIVLWKVAQARGQSAAYTLWGLLGWLGLIIGLLIMMAMPKRGAAP